MEDKEKTAAWMDTGYDAVFSKEKEENGPTNLRDSKYEAAFKEDPEEATPLFAKEKKKKKTVRKTIQHIVQRNCCHTTFILISTYSSISLLCLLFSQFIPLYFHHIRALELALRCYVGLFGLGLFLVEAGLSCASITESGLIANWLCRGIIHSFLGLINEVEAVTIPNDKEGWTPERIFLVFQNVTSWMLVASGCLYALMGICCLDRFKKKLEDQYTDDLEKADMKKRLLEEKEFNNMQGVLNEF